MAVCTDLFSTCVLTSLHVFLPPLVFSITVAVEFCSCDNVRLIRQVIANHVNCSELLALWLTPIGIMNCVKVLRTWKKAFHILLLYF